MHHDRIDGDDEWKSPTSPACTSGWLTDWSTFPQQFQSDVRVLWNGRVADGKSILDLMTLGAGVWPCSSWKANGPDSEEAVQALTQLVESSFDEHDQGRCPACGN